MTSFFSIATLNCNGLADKARRLSIFSNLSKTKFTIILLQETHSNPSEETQWANEWVKGPAFFNSSPNSGKARGGVAILINCKNIKILKHSQDQQGRIITIDIDTLINKLHIVNIYGPSAHSHTATNEQKIFYNNLHPYIFSNFPIILGGDFNLVQNAELDFFPPPKKPKPCQVLNNLCQCYQLSDSYRIINPKTQNFTYRSKTNQSRIDRIYITPNIQIMNTETTHFPLSDHDLVSISTQINSSIPRGRGFWRNNTSVYKNENFQVDFDHNYNIWQQSLSLELNEPVEWWTQTKQKIKTIVQKHARAIAIEDASDLKELDKN